MKVKELMKVLSTCDPNWEVQVDFQFGLGFQCITGVYIHPDEEGAVDSVVFIECGD